MDLLNDVVTERLLLRPVTGEHVSAVLAGRRLPGWAPDFPSEGDQVQYALGLPGVTEVVAGVEPSNAASVRVLEKAGLTFRSQDGDEAQYAITRARGVSTQP